MQYAGRNVPRSRGIFPFSIPEVWTDGGAVEPFGLLIMNRRLTTAVFYSFWRCPARRGGGSHAICAMRFRTTPICIGACHARRGRKLLQGLAGVAHDRARRSPVEQMDIGFAVPCPTRCARELECALFLTQRCSTGTTCSCTGGGIQGGPGRSAVQPGDSGPDRARVAGPFRCPASQDSPFIQPRRSRSRAAGAGKRNFSRYGDHHRYARGPGALRPCLVAGDTQATGDHSGRCSRSSASSEALSPLKPSVRSMPQARNHGGMGERCRAGLTRASAGGCVETRPGNRARAGYFPTLNLVGSYG